MCFVWCFLSQQQFFSRDIRHLMGFLKVSLLFEVRRKRNKQLLFCFCPLPFKFGEGKNQSAIGLGWRIPQRQQCPQEKQPPAKSGLSGSHMYKTLGIRGVAMWLPQTSSDEQLKVWHSLRK